jgi:hypothetical protein
MVALCRPCICAPSCGGKTSVPFVISMNPTFLYCEEFSLELFRQRLGSGRKLAQTNCDCFSTVFPLAAFLRLDHPSYYHLHIHIVHTDFQGGEGMIIGKAWLLDDVIEQLSFLGPEGFKRKTITFLLGEETDLWKQVYSKLIQT